MTKTVPVHLGERSYQVHVGPGLLDSLGRTAAELPRARAAAVISDDTVAPLYADRTIKALSEAGLAAEPLTFPAGEPNKTLAAYGKLFDALFAIDPPIDRDAIIVALGGGVVGDLAGFIAATALRGLRFLQCPTTLLADVDSSVGGKTAVDHAAGKNLIGAFHQPAAVLIDVETLRSLPDAELANGLAECVKHGVIRDAGLLDEIEANLDALHARDADFLTKFVARNVAIKAAVVEEDEREQTGARAHLNFGHTVGHAVEALAGYEGLRHGEAVSLGMVAECAVAVSRGLLPAADADRVRALLERLGLPVRRAGLDADAVWQVMLRDKKNRGGNVRMVLPTALGTVNLFDDIRPEEIREAIQGVRP